MPRVVIELQANTAEAVAKIQQFAKAQRDTFDVIRAGNPAMDTARIKISQLTEAHGKATGAAMQWQSALGMLPGPLGNIASRVSMLTSVMTGPAGLAIAAAGVAVAIGGLAKSLSNDIERLDNLSNVTGLSVAALQSFEQAAREAGEAPEGLARGLGRVNEALAGVIAGKASASEAFEAIGVDLRTLVQNGASAEQILDATARALAGIVDPTQKAAAMADLFGSRTKALQVVLAAVAKDGVTGYVAAMRDAGIVTSEETNRASRELDAMADRFDRGLTFITNTLKAYAVEAVVNLTRVWTLTKQILDNPIEAGQQVRGQLAAPPAPPESGAAPGAPRQIMPSKAELDRTLGTALTAVQGLGTAFDEVAKKLQLQQFADQTAKAMEALTLQFNAGKISAADFATTTQALKDRLAEAERQGFVPVTQAAEKLTLALDKTAFGARELARATLEAAKGDLWQQFLEGRITVDKLHEGIQALNGELDMIGKEKLPLVTEAAGKTTEAFQTTDTAVKAVGDSIAASLFNIGAASEETIRMLDELIAKGKAAQGAASGGGGGGQSSGGGGGNVGSPTGTASLGGGVGTVLGNIMNQPAGSGLTPFSGPSQFDPTKSTADFGLTSNELSGTGGGGMGSILGPTPAPNETVTMTTFQHGGRVPGPPSRPRQIRAHGGELVGQPETLIESFAQALQRRGGGARGGDAGGTVVNIHPGAVQLSGTLIDQQRAWLTLVEELGQALEARLR